MGDAASKREAYEQWVRQWSVDLYRFAYRLAGRAEIAEDLVQEMFFHAWRSYGSLRDPARSRAWLFQILRFRYSHWVRSDLRQPKATAPIDAAGEPEDTDGRDPLEDLAQAESLQQALDTLDDRYRVPLLMVFMEGLTCREAAEELDLPLGTVLSRIHRARKALRKQLTDGETEPASGPQAQPAPRLRLKG